MTWNANSLENRIFVIAIIFSVAFHLFWISAVKIVTGSSNAGPVKFSKVSFLGPASGPGVSLEFKATPKEATFLEKRYREKIIKMPISYVKSSGISYGRPKDNRDPAHADENAMADLIEEALNSAKSEPAHTADFE